eukprot:2384458-Rhodomonas_salina.1
MAASPKPQRKILDGPSEFAMTRNSSSVVSEPGPRTLRCAHSVAPCVGTDWRKLRLPVLRST